MARVVEINKGLSNKLYMRKKVGLIKRIFTLLLVVLMSINSFAAIVSENDGSAFITKAEFDALKSSFQAQIDTYNASIDGKIDGAIASYLSGIKLTKEENLQNNYQTLKSLYTIYWNKSTSGWCTTKPTCKIDILLRWGSRTGNTASTGALDYKYTTSYSGSQPTLPIVTDKTYGTNTYHVIDTYQAKQSYFYFLGFYIVNPSSQFTNSSSTTVSVTGVFKCNGFNPNANKVYNKMDQWWNYKTTDGANWAMAIDGFLTEVNGSENSSTIYFWPDSEDTYFWNKSDMNTSSSSSSYSTVTFNRSEYWHGTGDGNTFNGQLQVGGVQGPNEHNLPWCQTTASFKNFIDGRLAAIFGKPSQIKEGMLLTSIEKPGTLKMMVTPNSPGSLDMRLKVDGTTVMSRTELTNKTESLTSTSAKTITWDLTSITIPDGKVADLWVVFRPTNSGNKTIEFSNITLTKVDE